MPADPTKRYLSAERMAEDDFGVKFTKEKGEVVYDAKTIHGPWATMTHASFVKFGGVTVMGEGRGQKYERQENGELWKVEG